MIPMIPIINHNLLKQSHIFCCASGDVCGECAFIVVYGCRLIRWKTSTSFECILFCGNIFRIYVPLSLTSIPMLVLQRTPVVRYADCNN